MGLKKNLYESLTKMIIVSALVVGPTYAGTFSSITDAFPDGWDKDPNQTDHTNSSVGNSDTVTPSSSSEASEPCLAEQTSVPPKILNILMLGSINTNHSSNTNEITVSSGPKGMIGNCNQMLRHELSSSKGNSRPYSFQTEIKKPTTGCRENDKERIVCKYTAYTKTSKEDGSRPKKIEIEVEPNLYGLEECLKQTGALNPPGEKIIVKANLSETLQNAKADGEVAIYCYGPDCNESANQLHNEISVPGKNSCQYFEQIQAGGKRIYSKATTNRNRMERKVKNLCRSGDLDAIENYLPNVRSRKDLTKVLVELRRNIILADTKRLSKKITAAGNFENYDAIEMKETFLKFNRWIINPLKTKILQYTNLIANSSNEATIKMLKAKREAAIKELRAVTSKQFVTSKQYGLMLDFARKAPLYKEEWRDAAIAVYTAHNTAHHFSRFIPKHKKKMKKKELALSIDDAIERDINKQTIRIEKLGILAEEGVNPGLDADGNKVGITSFARLNQDKANAVMQGYYDGLDSLQYEFEKEQRYERDNCYMQNAGMYGLVQQACIKKSREYQQSIYQDLGEMQTEDYLKRNIMPQTKKYTEISTSWGAIEASRNAAYGITTLASSYIPAAPRGQQVQNNNWSNGLRSTQADMGQMYQQMALQQSMNSANRDYQQFNSQWAQPRNQTSQWGHSGQPSQWGHFGQTNQWGQPSNQNNRSPGGFQFSSGFQTGGGMSYGR